MRCIFGHVQDLGIQDKRQEKEQKEGISFYLNAFGGTCLAQSVEHVILDLSVVSSSPTLGVEFT